MFWGMLEGAIQGSRLYSIRNKIPSSNGVFSEIVGKQMGSVAAHPTHGADSEYAVMVQIGSPPQSIPMNLDTGSADL